MLTLPQIETPRLFLRFLKVEDAADCHALETDPEVKQFLGGPSRKSVQFYRSQIAERAAGVSTTLAVTLKKTGEFLGRCGFTEYREFVETVGWEINIVLGRQCPKKQGYATEIGLALIRSGFDTLGCGTILGVAETANIASLKLCEKLGMKHKRDTVRNGRAARIYAIERHTYQMRSSTS